MQQVSGGAGGMNPRSIQSFEGCYLQPSKGRGSSARRNVSQKATGIEGAYGDESGGDREIYDRPHRPAGGTPAALRGLPAAVPQGAQRAQDAGMARSVDAETALETALPPPSSPMPQVRLAGGGLSLGRAVGPGDHGTVERGSDIGSGAELAGNGAPLRTELEERGDHCETGCRLWSAPSKATARAYHRH